MNCLIFPIDEQLQDFTLYSSDKWSEWTSCSKMVILPFFTDEVDIIVYEPIQEVTPKYQAFIDENLIPHRSCPVYHIFLKRLYISFLPHRKFTADGRLSRFRPLQLRWDQRKCPIRGTLGLLASFQLGLFHPSVPMSGTYRSIMDTAVLSSSIYHTTMVFGHHSKLGLSQVKSSTLFFIQHIFDHTSWYQYPCIFIYLYHPLQQWYMM
jgi:hypothetical protein